MMRPSKSLMQFVRSYEGEWHWHSLNKVMAVMTKPLPRRMHKKRGKIQKKD